MNGLPPQSLDAEISVLGSVMLREDAFDEVDHLIDPEDFYYPSNKTIFQVCRELRSSNKPIDSVSITTWLEKLGMLDAIGGVAYIGRIMEATPSTYHAEHHAQTVAGKSQLRKIIGVCRKAASDAMEGEESSEIIGEAESALLSILEKTATPHPMEIRDCLEEVFQRLDSGLPPGIPTGLEKLDELYQLQGGNLVVVAARPSMGKTGLAVNIALNVARQGKGVLFFSLEQNRMELAGRFLSCQSGVSSLKISRMEPIDDEDRLTLLEKSTELASLPIFTVDDPGITVNKIAAHSRLWKRKRGIELVVVDYLQLIEPDDRRLVREQQVATMSRSLKKLAGQLNIPVIVMAQLNRESEKRPDKKPRLSDLRESGAIEQDANCVILIHRPEYYNLNDRPGEADLDLAKNRDGKTGSVAVQFDQSTVTFRNLAAKWQSGWVTSGSDDF
jgi:replicative DNA helicase